MVGWRQPIFCSALRARAMARTCAEKGCTQAVALYERPVPVFPALRECASPHERARVFPAVRGKRGSAAFSFGSHPFEAADG